MMELPLTPEESEDEKLLRSLQVKGLIDLQGLHTPNYERTVEGRYLQARVRINDPVLEDRFREFTLETGVGISADAENLIKVILNAILSDPHPAWTATAEERVEIVASYISSLPQALTTLANEESVEGQITSFHVLHWLSTDEHLAGICIIDR